MTSNPLVASASPDDPDRFEGIYLVEDVEQIAAAIRSHSWVDGALGGLSLALDGLAAASDPLGTALTGLAGWAIEHIEPLREVLDQLAGDPGQVAAHAQTWRNIASALGDSAHEHDSAVAAETGDWTGDSSDAYRNWAGQQGTSMSALSAAAKVVADATEAAGFVVATVRQLVRDLISQCIAKAISFGAEELFTLGFATPLVIEQFATFVAAAAARIARYLHAMTRSIAALSRLVHQLAEKIPAIKKVLSRIKEGAPRSHATGEPGSRGLPDEPAMAVPPHQPVSPGPAGHGDSPIDGRHTSGDPVDIASGEMILGERDVSLGAVLPVLLERRHISTWRAGRWFGPSWSSTLDARLEVAVDEVRMATGDALAIRFAMPAPGGEAVTDYGPAWRLVRVGDGSDVDVPESVRDHAAGSEAGLWCAVEPETSLRRWFTRVPGTTDSAGLRLLSLVAISDPAGSSYLVDHRPDGSPEKLRHRGGYEVAIDIDGGLIRSYRLVGAAVDRLLRSFRYDEDRRLIAVGDPDGSEHRFEYDAEGRITRWQDRTGFWYRYNYDHLGRVIESFGPDDTLRVSLSYSEDDRSRLVTDSLGAVTRYDLDPRRLVTTITEPTGGRRHVRYDERYLPVEERDAVGRTTTWQRDEFGRALAEVRPGLGTTILDRDVHGRITDRTDPGGATSTYVWDDNDRLVTVTDPLGSITSFQYDADSGGLAAIVEPDGGRTEIVCAATGLPVEIIDPLGHSTRYTYDDLGNLATATDPMGAITRWDRDEEGRPLTMVLPDDSRHRWRYDGEGHLIEHTGPAEEVTTFEIGHFGTVIGRTTPDGSRTIFMHDSELRLVQVTDARGLEWHYTYDPAGRLAAETDYDGIVTLFQRDAAGRMVGQVVGAGLPAMITHHHELDDAGRVTASTSTSGQDFHEVVYTYDHAGRMLSAQNSRHRTIFQYDDAGHLVAEGVDDRLVRYEYDATGRRTSRTLPDGTRSTWSYDDASRPVALDGQSLHLDLTWNEVGRLRRTATSGVGLDQTYDVVGRLLGQFVSTGSHAGDSDARTIVNRAYSWRPDGYPTRIEDTLLGVRDYELDRAGRILSTSGPAGRTESYSYDQAGGLTSARWPATDPADIGEREYERTRIRRAGRTSYEYDALGRLTRRTARTLSGDRKRTTFEWNTLDQLIRVATGSDEWTYTYDALGRRITKTRLGAESSRFDWEDSRLAAETDERATRSWDYLPGSSTVVTQTVRTGAESTGRIVITDVAGTPTHMLDPTGSVITWSRRSSVWGVRSRDAHSGEDCPLDHPGQYVDRETGLSYNVFRNYDPVNATYVETDPIGLAPAINNRAYVHNPQVWLDTLGLSRGGSDYSPGRLSDPLPRGLSAAIAKAYDDIRLGNLHQRLNPEGTPDVLAGREAHLRKWAGAEIYDVPGARNPGETRILLRHLPDGRIVMGYTTNHYATIQEFRAPHFPDSGWPT